MLVPAAQKNPETSINTNVYGLFGMLLRAAYQWSEIGMNGVETANNGNLWQSLPTFGSHYVDMTVRGEGTAEHLPVPGYRFRCQGRQ